ncbi:cytochrome P450 [Gloeopeniophorella convolvens]|nr:cytochrome P450 [Gloeopeniophorella convolvens]
MTPTGLRFERHLYQLNRTLRSGTVTGIYLSFPYQCPLEPRSLTMASIMSPYTLLSFLSCVFLLYKLVSWWSASRVPFPPGPRGHWLWGPKIPGKHTFLKFSEWTQQYGPVCSFRRGRHTTVVIGTYEAAMEIMEKSGAITAERPRSVAGGEMLSGDMRILLVRGGERMRRLRKALHSHLQLRAVVGYESMQLTNALQLIRDILEKPEDHMSHAKRFSGSLILSLTYGRPSPSARREPDLELIQQFILRLGRAVRPGAHFVDDFPWLKHIPWYGRSLRSGHVEELALFHRLLGGVRDEMAKDVARPSFGKYLIEAQGSLLLSEPEIEYLAGSMFGAGSETTSAAISYTIMAAACHPDAQARVQKELDAVVGPGRVPTFADMGKLQQVQAFVLEVFRWRPGTSAGFPHCATKDIIWRGYRIPAGATLIANHWSIARDPSVYADGDRFDPQRWIDEKGHINESPKFPNFGFGRRVCPGLALATKSMFITTAQLFHAFKIEMDPNRPIDTLNLQGGIVTLPLPFAARFLPRSEDVQTLYTNALEAQ